MKRRWPLVLSWLQSVALAQDFPLIITIGVPICRTNSMPTSLSSVLPTYSTLSSVVGMPALTSSMRPSPSPSAPSSESSHTNIQTDATHSTNTKPSSSCSTQASLSSFPSTYVSGQKFTSQRGLTYLYASNTALSGTTIEILYSGMRRRQDPGQNSSAITFTDCVTYCDETSMCVALSIIGTSCLLYGVVQGSMMTLGAQTAFNEQRFHGFVNVSSSATSSNSVAFSSAGASSPSISIGPSSTALDPTGPVASLPSSSMVILRSSEALSSSTSQGIDYSTPALSTSHATTFTPPPSSSLIFSSLVPASSALQTSGTTTSLEPNAYTSDVVGTSSSAASIPNTMMPSGPALISSASGSSEIVSFSSATTTLGVSSSTPEVQSSSEVSSMIGISSSFPASSSPPLSSTSILMPESSTSLSSTPLSSTPSGSEFLMSIPPSSTPSTRIFTSQLGSIDLTSNPRFQQSAAPTFTSASSKQTPTSPSVPGSSMSSKPDATTETSILVVSLSTSMTSSGVGSSSQSSSLGISNTRQQSTSTTGATTTTSFFSTTLSSSAQSSSSSPISLSSTLSVTSSSPSTIPSATPVRNTGKRGLCYTNDTYTLPYSLSGQNSQVSWGYDYYYSRYTGNDTIFNPAITFIPLLFNDAPDLLEAWPANAQQAIDEGADSLLSFNEPDSCYSGSACMTVNQSVIAYMSAMQPFAGKAKLGAPAVTNGGPRSSLTWLGEFLGNCTQCTIDFVPLHWYSNVYAFSYLQYYVELAYNQTGLPIWVTEFGIDSSGGSDAQFQAFLEQALPWLDAVPCVERYAYFYDGPGFLVNANGSGLSAQGVIYNSYTAPCEDWDNSQGHC